MNKLNLFLILISSIIFNLMTRVVEGACNYNFNDLEVALVKSLAKKQLG